MTADWGSGLGATIGGCGLEAAGAGATLTLATVVLVEVAGATDAAVVAAGGLGWSTLGATEWWARAATDADSTSLGFSTGSGGSADFGNALSAT